MDVWDQGEVGYLHSASLGDTSERAIAKHAHYKLTFVFFVCSDEVISHFIIVAVAGKTSA